VSLGEVVKEEKANRWVIGSETADSESWSEVFMVKYIFR